MCSIANNLLKNQNSQAVYCVLLSETTVSNTLNLAKISCKKFIVTEEVGLLHFNIFGYLV